MDTLILQIMNQAQKLVNADRASLFLVDSKTNQLYARYMALSLTLNLKVILMNLFLFQDIIMVNDTDCCNSLEVLERLTFLSVT